MRDNVGVMTSKRLFSKTGIAILNSRRMCRQRLEFCSSATHSLQPLSQDIASDTRPPLLQHQRQRWCCHQSLTLERCWPWPTSETVVGLFVRVVSVQCHTLSDIGLRHFCYPRDRMFLVIDPREHISCQAGASSDERRTTS